MPAAHRPPRSTPPTARSAPPTARPVFPLQPPFLLNLPCVCSSFFPSFLLITSFLLTFFRCGRSLVGSWSAAGLRPVISRSDGRSLRAVRRLISFVIANRYDRVGAGRPAGQKIRPLEFRNSRPHLTLRESRFAGQRSAARDELPPLDGDSPPATGLKIRLQEQVQRQPHTVRVGIPLPVEQPAVYLNPSLHGHRTSKQVKPRMRHPKAFSGFRRLKFIRRLFLSDFL